MKVIANTGGQPTEGVSSVMDLFTSKGGTNMAAGIEALAQSPMGEAFLKRLGITAEEAAQLVADLPTADAEDTADAEPSADETAEEENSNAAR